MRTTIGEYLDLESQLTFDKFEDHRLLNSSS
jgi:hypothetical protein